MYGIPASVVITVASYFIFSAAVGAMSRPSAAQEDGFYGWFYRFLQRLAANADRLAETRFPALVHTDEAIAADGTSSKTTDIISK